MNREFLEEIADFCALLSQKTKKIITQYYRKDIHIEMKADETPVSIADKELESLLRQCIKEKYPHHGIIGEEWGNEREDAEFVWVLDPIDGTKSFYVVCLYLEV